ncbi:MAG: hypothetical protein ABI925_12585 [Verrucomicrobiota bacterium]
MSSQSTGLRVASLFFALFSIAHIVRLINRAPAMVGTIQIPLWVSVVALIIGGTLCIWMWRLSSARG